MPFLPVSPFVTQAPPGGRVRVQSRWDVQGRLEISFDPRVTLTLDAGDRGHFTGPASGGAFERLSHDRVWLACAPGLEAIVRVGMTGELLFITDAPDAPRSFLRALTGSDRHVISSGPSREAVSATVATFVQTVQAKSAFDVVLEALRGETSSGDDARLLTALDEVLAYYQRPLSTHEHLAAPLGGLAGQAAEPLPDTELFSLPFWARLQALVERAGARPGRRIERLAHRLEDWVDDEPALPFVTAALLFATLRPAAETLEVVREALAEARLPADEQTWLRWLGGDTLTPLDPTAFRRFPWPFEMKVAQAIVEALGGDLTSARARLGEKLEAKVRAPVRKTKLARAPMRDQVAAQAIISMVEPALVAPEVLRESFRRLFDWSGERLETVSVHRARLSHSRVVPLQSVLEHLPFIELLRLSVEPLAPLALVQAWLWPRRATGGLLVGPSEDEEVDRGVREKFASAVFVDSLSRQFHVPAIVTEPLRAMVSRRLRGGA